METSVFSADREGSAVGGFAVSCSPDVVEIFGHLGLDFAFVDLEHGGFSPWDGEPLKHLARTAEAAGIELVVRLPSGAPDAHPPLVRKVLDTGVRNVLLPRVESVEPVAAAIEAARFDAGDGTPGQRGIGSARASKWGRGLREDGFLAREDESVHVGAMIENDRIVEELDELLALPGLDFVFVGPGDLSHALGHPMAFDHPAVAETVEQVEAAVRASPVTLGGVFVHEADEMLDRGYQLVVLDSDYGAVYRGVEDRLADLDLRD